MSTAGSNTCARTTRSGTPTSAVASSPLPWIMDKTSPLVVVLGAERLVLRRCLAHLRPGRESDRRVTSSVTLRTNETVNDRVGDRELLVRPRSLAAKRRDRGEIVSRPLGP